MVTVEHEIPSGMEYQYADHTISERPGPILKAGMGSTSQAEHPPAPSQGPNSGQYAVRKTAFVREIDSMSQERRRQFYIELDTIKQKKLSQASQRGGPNHALNDYQLQLEILELENKKRHLQRRIDQDAGQAIASPLQLDPTAGRNKDGPSKPDFHVEPGSELGNYSQSNHALRDYEMQIKLLEHHSKDDGTAQNAPPGVGMRFNASSAQNYQPYYPNQPLHPTMDFYMGQMPHVLPIVNSNPATSTSQYMYGSPPMCAPYPPGIAFQSRYAPVPSSEWPADLPKQSIESDHKPVSHPFVSGPSNCLPDYQKQLDLLQQQNKTRVFMTTQDTDSDADSVAGQDGSLSCKSEEVTPEPFRLLGGTSQDAFMVRRQEESRAARMSVAWATSPDPRSYLYGSPMTSSPAPSSVVYTPESSVASPPLGNEFNDGRPLAFRIPPQPSSFSS